MRTATTGCSIVGESDTATGVQMARKSDDEKIGELQTRIDQLRARKQAIEARKRTAARKLDTRRKIILGGSVMAILRAPEHRLHQSARDLYLEALNMAPERDQPVLRDWESTR